MNPPQDLVKRFSSCQIPEVCRKNLEVGDEGRVDAMPDTCPLYLYCCAFSPSYMRGLLVSRIDLSLFWNDTQME